MIEPAASTSRKCKAVKRAVTIPRIRCPYCGGTRRKVYATRWGGAGDDIRRYCRCLACFEKFHVIETDDYRISGIFHGVELSNKTKD